MKNPSLFDPKYKQQITVYLHTILEEKKDEFSNVNKWGSDVCEKLVAFIGEGKMIRGNLVLVLFEAYAGKITDDAIRIAAAIEFFHLSFLIHDDIMDNDIVRRGNPTIFAQYQSFGEHKKFPHPHHFGESMGISVGDIGFFLGFELLSSIRSLEI